MASRFSRRCPVIKLDEQPSHIGCKAQAEIFDSARHACDRASDAWHMELILPLAGVILDQSALAAGFLAAMIAIGGFLARAQALLGTDPQADVRRWTVVGGLTGLWFGSLIILLDVAAG